MRRLPGYAALLTTVLLVAGCSQQKVEVVDIDKVLEIFEKVSKTRAPGAAPELEDATPEDAKSTDGSGIVPLAKEDVQRQREFLKLFADELNKAKLLSSPIGVQLLSTGAFEGFKDTNGDFAKDSREPRLFLLEIDGENGRIIATQVVTGTSYRRHRPYYGYGYGHGYFGYWMMGSMWGRQNRYYGSSGRTRPNYGGMAMSRDGYRTQAVSRARSARGGARSRGGSRGFSGGK